jgi:hypothetical protein
MRFDLSDLRLCLSVVEKGSLTRGAHAMNLALASASERIFGMEAVLGALFGSNAARGANRQASCYLSKLLANNQDWVWIQESAIPLQDGFLNKWRLEAP